jgi:cystathionine beta-lyase
MLTLFMRGFYEGLTMFDFSTVVDDTAPGVRSGTMSPTALAPPTCCPSPSRIWISPPRPACRRRCKRINHGVFGYSRWKNDEFLAAVATGSSSALTAH